MVQRIEHVNPHRPNSADAQCVARMRVWAAQLDSHYTLRDDERLIRRVAVYVGSNRAQRIHSYGRVDCSPRTLRS